MTSRLYGGKYMQKEKDRLKKAIAKRETLKTWRARRSFAVPEPYRSWYEAGIALDAHERKIDFTYESQHLVYVQPAQPRKYKPDFFVTTKSGKLIIVEAKGRFTSADRKKMCYIVEQNPNLDVRMLFERNNKLTKAKNSKTYTQWCKSKGIPCAVGTTLPEEWLNE
jgi:hypothetical protein